MYRDLWLQAIALHLAANGFHCYGFNAGARALDAPQFVNQKAEAHWTLRSYLQDNLISGLLDEETAAQLSTIRYRENSRGLTEIETKEQRNHRGIPGSPDRAESTVMAFMKIVPQQATIALNPPGGYQISPIRGSVCLAILADIATANPPASQAITPKERCSCGRTAMQ